jgi:hypothetical protein|tara:strand:+ start:2561 stop:2809 length:249 start_codon:yes stop_codon:yes gene_type:complete
MADIKIRFKQAFYSNDMYYNKGETYTLPADTPIPSRDIEILEGKSTYKPTPNPTPTPSNTKMRKTVAAATLQLQKENIAAKE